MNKQTLRFGLPKGSLQEATLEKMAKADLIFRLEADRTFRTSMTPSWKFV
jgi:ATP phosphoribosyltransferase